MTRLVFRKLLDEPAGAGVSMNVSGQLLPAPVVRTKSGMEESIASAVIRTADANCISVGTLLRLAMPAELGRHRRGPRVNTKLIMRPSSGGSDWQRTFCERIHNTDRRAGTLDLFEGICAHQGLYRRTLAWCPRFLAGLKIPYYPLIWLIDAVRVCPIRGTPLVSRCPQCGEQQPYLTEHMHVAECHMCGASLDDVDVGWLNSDLARDTEQMLDFECWVAAAVRRFIAFRSRADLSPGFNFSQTLGWWLERYRVASLTEASGLLGFPSSCVAAWLIRGHLPRLRSLLRVCDRLGTDLVGFVKREAREARVVRVRTQEPEELCGPKRGYRRTDPRDLQERMRRVLDEDQYPEMPLSRICSDHLGVGLRIAYRYCRDEALKLAARFKTRRRDRIDARNRRFVAEVRSAALNVASMGRAPRHDTISPYVSHPSWLWRPWAKQAIADVRRELGFDGHLDLAHGNERKQA